MYAIHRFAKDVTQIVLPPHASLPLPWGYPRSVYLLGSDNFALIDTGFASARAPLLYALAELGVSPDRIARVLLTGDGPARTGNLAAFPRALAVRCVAPQDGADGDVAAPSTWAEEVALTRTVLSEVLLEPDRPKAWSLDALQALELSGSGASPQNDVREHGLLELEEGEPVAAANFVFDAFSTGGVGGRTSAYYAADRRYLFSGDVLSTAPRPAIRGSDALLASLDKLHSLSTAAILPAIGAIDTSKRTAFRGAHQYATNLRTNMQYVLTEPRTAAGLMARDLGHWPEDPLRFTGRVIVLRIMLEELVAAGVATRTVDEGRTFYQMGTGEQRAKLF